MKRAYALFLRQVFLLRHNPLRFINIFAWGIIDIIIWGFITRYLDSIQQQSFSFVPMLLGAAILWNFLTRVHQGVIISTLEDVWSHNFLNLFASPLTIKEYIGGLIFSSIATSLAALILLIGLSALFFGYNIFTLGLGLFIFLAILFVFGTTLGVFASASILRFGPSAEWIAWLMPAVILPFSGVYYPVASLPPMLQYLAKILPTTYAFEGMRSIILGQGFNMPDALLGCALAAFYLLLAYFFFTRVYRTILKRGLITRFSAESTQG